MELPRPHDINTRQHFWGAFERSEREVSAKWLVRFAQEKEDQGELWPSFTRIDIEEFYNRKLDDKKFSVFYFNGLDERYHIIKKGDVYSFTSQFIERCHKSSPATFGVSIW